ncbi:hypothetical protein ACFQ08_20735, partial [Streptosporangium algeriense]
MEKSNPVRDVIDKIADKLSDGHAEIPGSPGSEPPSVDEPTEPRGPLRPKPDQRGPDPFSATGQEVDVS